MKPTLKHLRDTLVPLYGRGEANAMIRLIFHHLKGWNTTDMIIHEGDTLSDYMRQTIRAIADRLALGEPVQYILGETEFCGLRLKVGPGVLIPRPETAELVDMILARHASRADLRITDLCTGSGAIALALARHLRFPSIVGVDNSPLALSYALENNRDLHTRVTFRECDIFSPEIFRAAGSDLDLLVSNPPYILPEERSAMERTVLDYEPAQALFAAENDPLLFYRRIAEVAAKQLRPGGEVYLEINPLCAKELQRLYSALGPTETLPDIHGRQRFLHTIKD